MSTVYQAVTADQYEIPVIQEDTLKPLAEKLGYKSVGSLLKSITRGCKRKYSGMKVRVIRVKLDDEED